MRAEERVAAWTGVAWEDFTGFQVRDEKQSIYDVAFLHLSHRRAERVDSFELEERVPPSLGAPVFLPHAAVG
jgi:hypothetical protein